MGDAKGWDDWLDGAANAGEHGSTEHLESEEEDWGRVTPAARRRRHDLIQDLAAILAPTPNPILEVDDDGSICVDGPKLADALIAAGCKKVWSHFD